MTTTIVSIAAFALLFALFGVLRPKAGCGGSCGTCKGDSCTYSKSGTDHV